MSLSLRGVSASLSACNGTKLDAKLQLSVYVGHVCHGHPYLTEWWTSECNGVGLGMLERELSTGKEGRSLKTQRTCTCRQEPLQAAVDMFRGLCLETF